jgi:hypothetical protein
MDTTMPDRALSLSLWGIWWNAILLLRPAFSRLRTFMWFVTAATLGNVMVGVFSPWIYGQGLNVGSTSPSHRISIYFSYIMWYMGGRKRVGAERGTGCDRGIGR